MKTFLRILSFAFPIKLLIPQYLLYTILYTAFSIANFSFIMPMLNILFDKTPTAQSTLPPFELSIDYAIETFNYYLAYVIENHGKSFALMYICVIIVLSTFSSNLFKYLSNLILVKVRINVITNLRKKYFNKIVHLDLSYFTHHRRGDIMSRGTSDVVEIESSVVSAVRAAFKDPFMIIGIFIVLFKISVPLTLYTVLLLPISGVIISQIVKKLRSMSADLQHILGSIGAIFDESIGGIRIIKSFGIEKYMEKKFSGRITEYAKFNLDIAKRHELAPSVSEVLGATTLALLILLGGQQVLDGTGEALSPAQFMGFIVLFSQILPPAKSFVSSFSAINKGIASAERVFNILDEPILVKSEVEGKSIKKFDHAIELNNVSFAYEEKPVIKGITFAIPKGKVVALVGASGGGKSTISDLICRFYDPQKGEILLDNHNIKEYDLSDLRSLMGFVTQESILFNDSIRNNIAFGHGDSTPIERVIESAKIANAHEFITKLPEGYNTEIGERGSKLSGGQRQRISIARAILKNPPIMLLDEATSALDSKSEKLVQNAIFSLMKNRTVLVIAHRLSTIQHADEIIVIDQGAILERGNHNELLKKKGLYKKLIEMQSF